MAADQSGVPPRAITRSCEGVCDATVRWEVPASWLRWLGLEPRAVVALGSSWHALHALALCCGGTLGGLQPLAMTDSAHGD